MTTPVKKIRKKIRKAASKPTEDEAPRPAKTAKKKTAKKTSKKTAKKTAKKKTSKKSKPAKGDSTKGSLDQRRAAIRARHGGRTVRFRSDKEEPRIPTRFARLNRLLGGGLKRGAIIEGFGWEDSAKTSSFIAMAADVQKASPPGKRHVVMANYEMPEDYDWWEILGLDTSDENFTQLRPDTLEEGMADVADLVESGEVCAVLIDSVYAAAAKNSRDAMDHWRDPSKGGGTGGGIAVEARQWGIAWTALKGLFMEKGVVVFAVNQQRIDVGKETNKRGPKKGWGGPATTTPRGSALKFYAWVRIELSGGPLLTEDKSIRKDVDGRRIRMKIVKNKTSADARGVCYYDIVRGLGFDLTGELLDLCLEAGVINHSGGGHYTCAHYRIHGRQKLRDWIEADPERRQKLRLYVDRWLAKQEIEDVTLEPDED